MTILAVSARILAFGTNRRHMRDRESDGRGTRQSGQILTEAATTNSLRVIRLLLDHYSIKAFDIFVVRY
jgi:hypothetical protein